MFEIFNVLGSVFGYILYGIFYVVQNFGLAIIIFTLFFKIVLFPSSVRQQKSMAANSRMQAKQRELKEKYGNDKQKYNEEVQKLYDKEGASPFSGCLTSFFPFIFMLGIYYSVVRPLTNVLHIATDKVETILEVAKSFPGISINSTGLYSQIDVLRLFHNPNTLSLITQRNEISGLLTQAEIDKITHLSDGFSFLGFDLLSTPRIEGILSVAMLIPVLCLVTSVGSQFFSMRLNGNPMNNQQGCMKYMLLALPLLTAYIAYTVPCAVGFYWICSTVFGFIQTLILSKLYSPAIVIARKEAAHVALLEQKEKLVPYDYQPVTTAKENTKKK